MARAITPIGGPGIVIVGLPEFRRELNRMAKNLSGEMSNIHKEVARYVAGEAKSAAPRGTKSAIKGRGNRSGAFIDVHTKPVRALGTFMGAERRFGWYAHPRYAASTGRQFEPWVGDSWSPGDSSGKPYFIGDAINDALDPAFELIGDKIEDLARRAFPSSI